MVNLFYSDIIPTHKSTIIFKVDSQILVKGPLGTSFLCIPKTIFFEKNEKGYCLFGFFNNKNLIVTYYKLLLNTIQGVNLGFFEIITINGLG